MKGRQKYIQGMQQYIAHNSSNKKWFYEEKPFQFNWATWLCHLWEADENYQYTGIYKPKYWNFPRIPNNTRRVMYFGWLTD